MIFLKYISILHEIVIKDVSKVCIYFTSHNMTYANCMYDNLSLFFSGWDNKNVRTLIFTKWVEKV